MKNLITIIVALGITLPLVYSFTRDNYSTSETGIITEENFAVSGQELFQKNCAACHGINKQGNPPAFPSLVSINERMNKRQISELLQTGRNNMPSFAHLSVSERNALTGYLFGEKTESSIVTDITPVENGKNLFVANCANCHKARPEDPQPPNKRNRGMQPAVLGGITLKHELNEFENILNAGPCYMPSFESLSKQDKENIYDYLETMEDIYSETIAKVRQQCGMRCRKRK